jgi:DNA repair exonuclease SbcCD ATPase subunit
MDDPVDHRARALHLQTENEFLRCELEEYHFRERNLRKELEIMAQVREEQSRPPQRDQQMAEELEAVKGRMGALSA